MDVNNEAFIRLFKEAYKKCFGASLVHTLSETESKHFSNNILEATGLVIGAKSIKNYSVYIINNSEAKPENPSVATLDTLARYVLDVPYTDEIKRKTSEGHFPYWYQYKSNLSAADVFERPGKSFNYKKLIIIIPVMLLVSVVILFFTLGKNNNKSMVENFHSTDEDTLRDHGWLVQSRDSEWWQKRGVQTSQLTLYTLRGDNWPDSANTPVIKNLLLRKIAADCFSAEIHLNDFTPAQEWQQAGLILMEDTTFSSKCIRLSIAFNDFFGGYHKPKEIIIQAISTGGIGFTKPEEIAHISLYNIEFGSEDLVHSNMKNSALRIEKAGNHFRFLYSTGSGANFAFKEAFVSDIELKPKYIGIFALEGFVKDTNYMPVHFNYFNLVNNNCTN